MLCNPMWPGLSVMSQDDEQSTANERSLESEVTNERPGMGDELIPGHHGWSLTRVDIRLIESHIETQIRSGSEEMDMETDPK